MYAAITAEHNEEGHTLRRIGQRCMQQSQQSTMWKGHALDEKRSWLSRTLLQLRERLERRLRSRQLEEAGLVQNSWTISIQGGESRGRPSAAVEAATAAAGRGGRWLGGAGRRAGQGGAPGSPYPGKCA